MTHKIKDFLGVAGIISMLLLSFSAMSYVSSYSKSIEPTSFRSFNASGEGKANGIPDVASFSFSVITQGGKDIGALQEENTLQVNKAIDFVKSEGVKAEDIKTADYDLNPRYQNFNCYDRYSTNGDVKPCPPPEIVGYTITQSVSVKVRDFKKIGGILSGVVQNGANSVSSLSFKIDDLTELQNMARAEAIMKAKAKAQSIAKAGGFRLGRLLGIDEGGYGGPIPYYENYGRGGIEKAFDVAATAPSIEPGSKDITVTVNLRYEID